jgi:hypothetical protein
MMSGSARVPQRKPIMQRRSKRLPKAKALPSEQKVNLTYSPWADDPDPPDYMTDDEIARGIDKLVDGE